MAQTLATQSDSPVTIQIPLGAPGSVMGSLKEAWDQISSNPIDSWRISLDLWSDGDSTSGKPRFLGIAELAHILTFVQALLVCRPLSEVRVRLLPLELLKNILHPVDGSPPSREIVRNVRERVRFMLACRFPHLLGQYSVTMEPSLSYFMDTVRALKAEVTKTHPFSSTMMPLSELIDNPVDNTDLAERLGNVKSLLRNQVYYVESPTTRELMRDEERAEIASTLFMFELVKNVYQHAFHTPSLQSPIRGYTGAQVRHFPSIPKAPVRMKRFARLKFGAHADTWTQVELEQKIRFLSVVLSDFGCGLVSRVREDLQTKLIDIAKLLETASEKDRDILERYSKWATSMLDGPAVELLMLACTTPYTSKVSLTSLPSSQLSNWLEQSIEQIDAAMTDMRDAGAGGRQWQEKVELIENGQLTRRILHPAGYGLGYCLLFVARHFGTMLITSDNYSITFSGREEAYTKFRDGEYSLTQGLFALRTRPSDLLDIEKQELPTKAAFPGTQVLVDIPICFRWADREPERLKEAESELNQIYQRLIGAATA